MNAVASGASFSATIGARCRRRASSSVSGAQTMPLRMADDEGHFLGRAERRGDDEIAFVFAIVVIGDDDDLAARHGLDGFSDGMGQ